jgi:hypothetical protein
MTPSFGRSEDSQLMINTEKFIVTAASCVKTHGRGDVPCVLWVNTPGLQHPSMKLTITCTSNWTFTMCTIPGVISSDGKCRHVYQQTTPRQIYHAIKQQKAERGCIIHFWVGLVTLDPSMDSCSKLTIVFPFEMIQPYSGCPARFKGLKAVYGKAQKSNFTFIHDI